jgi:hypothetical protein
MLVEESQYHMAAWQHDRVPKAESLAPAPLCPNIDKWGFLPDSIEQAPHLQRSFYIYLGCHSNIVSSLLVTHQQLNSIGTTNIGRVTSDVRTYVLYKS